MPIEAFKGNEIETRYAVSIAAPQQAALERAIFTLIDNLIGIPYD